MSESMRTNGDLMEGGFYYYYMKVCSGKLVLHPPLFTHRLSVKIIYIYSKTAERTIWRPGGGGAGRGRSYTTTTKAIGQADPLKW